MAYSQRRTERQRAKLNASLQPAGTRASFWFTVLLVLAAVSGVALMYVRFNSEQVKMGRKARELRQEFALRSKELENMRIEVETYKNGTYIRNAVSQLRLGLREPVYGQVLRVRDGKLLQNPEWIQDSMVAKK